MAKQTGGFMAKLAVPLGLLGLRHLYTKKRKATMKSKNSKKMKTLKKTLKKALKSRRKK